MIPRSVRGRLLLWSGGLTAAALLASWWGLSALLSDFVARRLAAELAADARGIMAAAEWDETKGTFAVRPAPADPRFGMPQSGWYWQVADGERVLARSPSLLSADLGPDGAGTAVAGAALRAHREGFTAPGDGRALTVTVTLPEAEVAAELAAVCVPLALGLAGLGVALVLAQVAAVRAGLADLLRFSRAVAAVRDGRAERIAPPAAAELVPLAAELDRLIAANRAQIERARAAAGDLAHALKTPLAVLANRAGPEDAALIARMDRMLRWHLRRARAAALANDPGARAPLSEVLSDVALVLRPAVERRGLSLRIAAEAAPDFRGDAEDLGEMIAALAENAAKWANGGLRIAARGAVGGRLVVEVADDGPGIPEADRARLRARGMRLDQSAPGQGLGLAIASDRAAAYGGSLALETAPEGGLLARLDLPAAPKT